MNTETAASIEQVSAIRKQAFFDVSNLFIEALRKLIREDKYSVEREQNDLISKFVWDDRNSLWRAQLSPEEFKKLCNANAQMTDELFSVSLHSDDLMVLRMALKAVYEDLGRWQLDRERAPVGPYAYHLMDKALQNTPTICSNPATCPVCRSETKTKMTDTPK